MKTILQMVRINDNYHLLANGKQYIVTIQHTGKQGKGVTIMIHPPGHLLLVWKLIVIVVLAVA